MADDIYPSFKEKMADGTIDLDNDDFKVMLLNSTHAFNSAHDEVADISANQISGTGYTAGGTALVSPTWVLSGDVVTFDAEDPSWTTATFTAAFAVIYDDTVAGDPLVCQIDFSGDQQVTAGTFTIQFNASGIITLT